MPELILALDVGTTTARAAVFEPGGTRIGLAGQRLETRSPAPGVAEQDAEAVWQAVRRAIDKALAEAGRLPTDIAAIGVTTQRASLVAWDRRTGVPLTPLVLWSDPRGDARAGELRAAGFFVSAQQAACKAEALLAELTPDPERVAIGGIDSLLIARLSGAHVTDRSQAWPLGWLDLASLDWNGALLEHQRLSPTLLPRLIDTYGPIAETRAVVFGAAVPITACIADQQAALFVHGSEPGTAKITFGTAAAIDRDTGGELTFKGADLPPLIVAHVAGATRWCVEGMVADAGPAIDRSGEAPAPREHLALRLREIADVLLAPDADLKVDGGLTRDDGLMQTCADLLQRRLTRFAGGEATVAGAALAAGIGAGLLTEADRPGFGRYDRAFTPTIAAGEADTRFEAWRRRLTAPAS
ncbi:MAG: FGGY family carbohydrate kinase [Caulobacteraceae bacterium]